MTTMPWLSVIMPVFNGARTLPASLASLEAGSEGIEIIAVDQGSSDGSRAMLEAAAQRLPLKIIDNPAGTCWTANTNLGLRIASAPLVTMLHQDDIWRPGRATRLAAMARDMPDVDLWVHGCDYLDLSGSRIGRMGPGFGQRPRFVPAEEAMSHLLVQNTIALPAAMFSRAAALRAGGLDETLWYTADWNLWLCLAKRGIGWHPEAAAGFRLHAGSLTMTGSEDRASFRAQLAAPPDRHLGAVSGPAARRIRRLSVASNALNAGLAGLHHRNPGDLLLALLRVLSLGPGALPEFLDKTQILARIRPRCRLAFRKGDLA